MKEAKDILWDAWFKAKELGASREATNAILDAMVILSKTEELDGAKA